MMMTPHLTIDPTLIVVPRPSWGGVLNHSGHPTQSQ